MPAPKKMKQRQRITLYMDAEQKNRLDRLAAKRGRPWAELVRAAVDDLLRKYQSYFKKSN
jgi:predicted DNA-binding protein